MYRTQPAVYAEPLQFAGAYGLGDEQQLFGTGRNDASRHASIAAAKVTAALQILPQQAQQTAQQPVQHQDLGGGNAYQTVGHNHIVANSGAGGPRQVPIQVHQHQHHPLQKQHQRGETLAAVAAPALSHPDHPHPSYQSAAAAAVAIPHQAIGPTAGAIGSNIDHRRQQQPAESNRIISGSINSNSTAATCTTTDPTSAGAAHHPHAHAHSHAAGYYHNLQSHTSHTSSSHNPDQLLAAHHHRQHHLQPSQHPPQLLHHRSHHALPIHSQQPSQPPLSVPSAAVAFHQQQPSSRSHVIRTQSPIVHHLPVSSTSSQPHRHGHFVKMEPSASDELAAQEAAARNYQPQVEGPLVGYKQSSHVITEEYAKADPIYVEKTLALPDTYSHFRAVKGDGNCGWRAIGFCYFENLINTATPAKIDDEHARIASLNQLLSNVGGYSEYVFEDMVDETLSLLATISQRLKNQNQPAAIEHLQAKFNEFDTSSAIVYHLRMLAASYLKGHPEYEPFTSGDIQSHCSNTIEPVDREIDHLSITLLVEVLLKPAGFFLEIAYLDRSPGSQVTVYRFPEEANGQDAANLGPMIHLLFRPDHYDILYKPPPRLVSPQVHHVSSLPQSHHMGAAFLDTYGGINYDVLSQLTPHSFGVAQGMHPQLPMMEEQSFTPSPQPSWDVPTSFSEPIAPIAAPPMRAAHPHEHYHSPPYTQTPSPPSSLRAATAPPQDHPVRFSMYNYKMMAEAHDDYPVIAAAVEQQTMTTATMRNSPLNIMHYNNPNFHPEEYKHPSEPEPARKGKRRKI